LSIRRGERLDSSNIKSEPESRFSS
jgi:hypothetical protein